MDVVHERAAGIDISKRDAKVAIRVPGERAGTFTTSVTTWGATMSQVLELIDFLTAEQVTTVVMEATSDYWKPFYDLMEDALPVMLVNAKQARNIPGRKTDVSDAAWLAQLAAHGLLRASLVPPEPVRQLRDLTRARTLADVIIAETGADMTAFETAAHLASWTGVCPGQNESAGRMKSSHTTHGNRYLKGALGVAAMSASRSKRTFLAARYRRLVTRRGKPRALVAIEHTILTAAWHMLRNGEAYDELGADFYTRRDPQRTRARAIRDFEALGYEVVITPVAA